MRTTVITLMCLAAILLAGCGQQQNEEADCYNEQSYAYHYRNLDSTRAFAERALTASANYPDGRAEALNNLAFVDMAKMDYAQAARRLDEIAGATDNQIELAIADIQQMRLCQRESHNKSFYEYQERAQNRLHRIADEQDGLNPHQMARLTYAQTEYNIVSSTYYYYVGQTSVSSRLMLDISPYGNIQRDTAQMLNYLYNIGSGGVLPDAPDTPQREFALLMRCYDMAVEGRYPYWEAQALQAISEHLKPSAQRDSLIDRNLPAIVALNSDLMPDSLLAGNLAQRSLMLFRQYGDVYQTAGAYRTLAECYWAIGDYRSALICLNRALNNNAQSSKPKGQPNKIDQAPDLVASIREQLSLTYSALNDKASSDYNRNIYLDMQEQTRQDRQLEARAAQLDNSSRLLSVMIAVVLLMIVIVSVLLIVFARMRRKSDSAFSMAALLKPLEQWQKAGEKKAEQEAEDFEEIKEQTDVARLHIEQNRERNLEQRAKVQLVNSILPIIDRMVNEVKRLQESDGHDALYDERLKYIAELTDSINGYNEMLTRWIQMRQGEVSLHIESFPLQPLFDIVKRGEMSFRLKGITLRVEPTEARVKADRVLTLFMINTIADNARKFTPAGGSVTISAEETPDYVEISVRDTGEGMSEETLSHIFDRTYTGGHGFGLKNCNGIIEKYKKLSRLFSNCLIKAESRIGKGTRIFFRLPPGRLRMLITALLVGLGSVAFASLNGYSPSAHRTGRGGVAATFADSAYLSNVNGQYAEALRYADSCYKYVARTDTLTLLDVSNEQAVAALALHKWSLYHDANHYYTHLFREASADSTLPAYVRSMQRNNTNKTVAVVLLVIMFIIIFPAYYFLYYRHMLSYRFCVERINRMNHLLLSGESDEEKLRGIGELGDFSSFNLTPEQKSSLNAVVDQIKQALKRSIDNQTDRATRKELAEDELRRLRMDNDRLYVSNSVLDNCLSTLKHETMYYPSRIRQLIDQPQKDIKAISEVVDYYHDLYQILSEQATRQVIPPRIGQDTADYMLEILKRCNKGRALRVSLSAVDEKYSRIEVVLDALPMTAEQARALFTPDTIDVNFLLCKQIVRDMGETTNLRACGIAAEAMGRGTVVKVTLPHRYAAFFQAH